MRRLTLAIAAALLALVAPPAAAAPFGEMFPELPDFTAPTVQQLADLAQTQQDPNADTENNCADTVAETGCVFAGMTYFGQFVDHDLTLDTAPSPTAPVNVATLNNNRTFRLDLDSVYGGGPTVSPQLYSGDRFLVQEPNLNGVRDLPRDANGRAILVEGRNDENQIIAQIHLAFLKAHNRLIDEGATFAQAQTILVRAYQQAVVRDFLPHILQPNMVADEFDGKKQTKLLKDLLKKPDFTPSEFAVASYRFGHSQVRRAYRLNANNNCGNLQVFALTDPTASLMGGRPIQAGRQINWGQFFEELPEPAGCEGNRNIGRKIDPLISTSLFQLPIPGAEAAGSNVLGFRNLVRAHFYGMPSGQAIAAALGLPVITPAELNLGPGFETGTPLWYYVLAEASRTQNGQRMGALGSRLNAAAFAAVLFRDKDAYVNTPGFAPDARIAGADGQVSVSDIIRFAGVAS